MKLLTFIIPIALYFIAEWLLGPLYAMSIAIAISLIFIIVEFVKTHKISSSHIADIILVGAFGAVEYLFADTVGLMYVVVSMLMALLLFLALYSPFNIFASMGGGLLAVMISNPYNRYSVRRCMRRMILWCFILAFAYIYMIMYPETQLAHWIDNYMLLTVFLGYIATEIIVARVNRVRYKKCEWVPLMDEATAETRDCKVIGQAPRPLVHNGSHWLHPVVHLHVINDGKLLLQLRPQSKKIQPGKWDTAVGGHLSVGEKLDKALQREAYEEIGLNKDFRAQFLKQYVWNSSVEKELVFTFLTDNKGPFVTKNVGEVDDLRFWTRQELLDALGNGVFTPNLEHELQSFILDRM